MKINLCEKQGQGLSNKTLEADLNKLVTAFAKNNQIFHDLAWVCAIQKVKTDAMTLYFVETVRNVVVFPVQKSI